MNNDSLIPKAEGTDDLFRRAQSGDEDAWNALFARLRPGLKRMLHGRTPRALRGVAETSDLVQDTLLQLTKALRTKSLESENVVRKFAAKVARNVTVDQARHGDVQPKREPAPADDSTEPVLKLEAADAFPSPEDRETAAWVLEGAAALGDASTLELWLRWRVHDVPLVELAQDLGLSYDAVRMRLSRFESLLKSRASEQRDRTP